jgi:hypothetical protein
VIYYLLVEVAVEDGMVVVVEVVELYLNLIFD